MRSFVVLAVCVALVCAGAPSAPSNNGGRPDSGIEAVGPASVKLQYHAPAQYPVQQPFLGYPYAGAFPGAFPGAPAVHPAIAAAAAAAAYGGAFGANPYAFNPYAAGAAAAGSAAGAQFLPPLNGAANVAPYFGGYLEEEADIHDEDSDMLLEEDDDEDFEDEDDLLVEGPDAAAAPAAAANPFAEAQANWNNYFAGPTSEFTWPGAPDAAPGVHPNLGGRLNPFNPLGAPSHPYPFPMHQGVKNGPRHPRPFTSTGAYYPGQSDIPPNFFGPAPILPYGFGFPGAFQAPYFPAAKNGAMQ